MDNERVSEILKKLEAEYPDAKPELEYKNAFELLVAAILSAQCTDKQVNRVTGGLFSRCPGPEEMAVISQEELEDIIRPCGFFHTKAKNLIAASNILVEKHSSRVPETLEELTELPGVGRKVANVVLSNAFSIPAIAVDTHVFRVSNRIGLAHAKNELSTEKELMRVIPRELWGKAHHWLIFHGRRVCRARNPLCLECPISGFCEGNGLKED